MLNRGFDPYLPSYVCVHPNQIGDNVTDCHSSVDDESLLHGAQCPTQCRCLGHAIACIGVDAGVLKQTSKFMKKIEFVHSIGSTNIELNFPKLLFLDISNTNLRSESFPKIHSPAQLRSLSLRNNSIEYITKQFLEGPVLRSLELQMNPLQTIASASFAKLSNLKLLNLSRCKLSSLYKGMFEGLVALHTLDLSYNPLDDLRAESFSAVRATLCDLMLQGLTRTKWLVHNTGALPNLCSIYVETNRICHYLPKHVACYSSHLLKGRCCKLMESLATKMFIFLILILLFGFHVVALFYWCRYKAKPIWKILMTISNFCGLFWSFYLLYVIFLQYYYGTFFFVYENTVVRSLHCTIVAMLFLVNYWLSLLTHFTRSYYHYLLIANPFKDRSIVLALYTGACVSAVTLPSALFLHTVFGEHIFLTNSACHIYPIISKNASYWYVYVAVFAVTDVIFRCSTAVLHQASSHALICSANTIRTSGGTGKKKAASFKLKCSFVLETVFLFISCAVQLLVTLIELNNDYVLACIVVLMVKDVLNPVFHTFMVSDFRNILFKPESLHAFKQGY